MSDELCSVTLPGGRVLEVGGHTVSEFPGAWGYTRRIVRDENGVVLFVEEAANQVRRVWVSHTGMIAVERDSWDKPDNWRDDAAKTDSATD